MEDKTLAQGLIGEKLPYKLEFKEGKLIAELDYNGALCDVGMVLKFDSESVLEALKAAIPGHFDDAIIDGAKNLLKGK